MYNAGVSGKIDGLSCGIAPGINTTDLSISQSKTGGGKEGLCFWAGAWWDNNTTDASHVSISTAPFRVYNNGSMYAASGKISGWSIDSYKMYKNASWSTSPMTPGVGMSATSTSTEPAFWAGFQGNGGNPFDHAAETYKENESKDWRTYTKFYVTNAGALCAKAGYIGGWTINSDALSYRVDGGQYTFLAPGGLSAYCADGKTRTLAIGAGQTSSITAGITTYGTLYASGAEISGTITATSGSFSRDVTIGGRSISNWITSGGYVYNISATSGSVGPWSINYSDTYGGYSLYGTDSSGYAIRLTPKNLYVTSSNYTFSTTWYKIYSAANASDIRLKHNINHIDEQYDILFDKLQPKTFHYNMGANQGNPNDIHFGFIAQDMLEIQKDLNLNNLSFVLDEQYYGLRIQEFIALNTWQIQKAKARITELENEVATLKEQFQTLINKE